MRFVDNKGWVYQAKTKMGLVIEIMDTVKNWIPADTVEEFMNGCASRIYNHYDVEIEYKDADTFVDELIKLKIIKEIN